MFVSLIGQAEPRKADVMMRAGFWIRAGAAAIDVLVFLVFAVTINETTSVLEARGTLTEAKARGLDAMLAVLLLAHSSMEIMIGATAGKLVTGIVITLPDGAQASPWTRLLRWSTKYSGVIFGLGYVLSDSSILYWLGGLLNGLLLIGCLRALGEDKQAWHDLWSHTAVVSRQRAAQMREVREEPIGPPSPT